MRFTGVSDKGAFAGLGDVASTNEQRKDDGWISRPVARTTSTTLRNVGVSNLTRSAALL